MAFMQPEITEEIKWDKIHARDGIYYVPADTVAPEDFGPDVERVERVEGYGARISAPGYLDSSEWHVFDRPSKALRYLHETFGDADDTARQILELARGYIDNDIYSVEPLEDSSGTVRAWVVVQTRGTVDRHAFIHEQRAVLRAVELCEKYRAAAD